jgi:hypothetical protein
MLGTLASARHVSGQRILFASTLQPRHSSKKTFQRFGVVLEMARSPESTS